jgi:tRNA (guanine37-N1)-methyltransferase
MFNSMNFHIITLFPKAFDSYLGESILKRAIEDKKIKVSFYNPRDFAENKWKRVDRPPYGGGPGLVIEAEPVAKAIEAALKKAKGKAQIFFLSPRGKQFTNEIASKAAKKNKHIIIVCGRYEGIDSRVKKIFKMTDISVGPFVLTGGELPAMLMVDVISRQVPGILGNFDSIEERRVSSGEIYTRPEVLKFKGKNYRVPKILLSGDRAKIEEWKKRKESI